jgi:oligosaccharide amylase
MILNAGRYIIMVKSYFNSLVTGNSGMLACIDNRGEAVRICWPDIDYPQHIDRLITGIICPGLWHGASWLHSPDWHVRQYYVEDTNIAVTEFSHGKYSLKVRQYDFAHPDNDVLSRCYEVENNCDYQLDLGFVIYSSAVSSSFDMAGTVFDIDLSALIHYRHGYYYGIVSVVPAAQYQLGSGAQENAERGRLYGNDMIGMMNDGSLLWECVSAGSGDVLRFTLNICFANDLKSLKRLLEEVRLNDPWKALDNASEFWHGYLDKARRVETGYPEIDRLYRRSVLVFALMMNRRTGALLAAPEVDEQFTRCGRYAYCWGRDAAFITSALDKCGLSDAAEAFFYWAARVQEDDGSWQQRFYMDGNLAPSWGLQIDEGGSVIWGILEHYKAVKNKDFLINLWPCVQKGVEFLIRYTDMETGLPWLSFDLWEERLGEHAYSSAAVYAGIKAGAEIAEITGKPQKLCRKWRDHAEKLREAIIRSFWKPEWNRFIRSIRVKMNSWGEEPSDGKIWLKVNRLSTARDYTLSDGTLDTSLLGLSIPFGVISADDERMISTAEILQSYLSVSGTGGLMRYEYDNYIGGNPWILTTLWAALFNIEIKDFEKAREYLWWAVKGATEQELLPEQVDKLTGKPAWVFPLTWSHAMFVLVLDKLLEAGELRRDAASD